VILLRVGALFPHLACVPWNFEEAPCTAYRCAVEDCAVRECPEAIGDIGGTCTPEKREFPSWHFMGTMRSSLGPRCGENEERLRFCMTAGEVAG